MPRLHEKRPGQVVALLVIDALGALSTVGLYLFCQLNHIVYASSTGLPSALFPTYLVGLLVRGGYVLLLFFLVFFGIKAGFWLTAVGYGLNLVGGLLGLDVTDIIVAGLCLWLVLCEPTRRYFRIGKAGRPRVTAPPVRPAAPRDRDPWEDEDRL